MLNDPRHIIEKVKVDIDVGSMKSAEKIKDEVDDFIKNEVLQIIESCFSEVTPDLGDRILRLDKLELSVDTSSWNIHSNKLKQEIRSEVEKQMKPILQQVKDKNLLSGVEISDQTEPISDQDLQVYGKDERVLKSLFHFLEHGALPWWVNSLEESRQLFSEDSLLVAIESNVDFVLRELTKNESNQPFNQRLIRQFSPAITAVFMAIRLAKVANAKRSIAAVKEIENGSKEVSQNLISLLWKLTDNQAKGVLFQKATSARLFEHIHTHFYQKKWGIDALNSSLKTTHSALRFLYLVSNRENEIEKMKTEFADSLNEQIAADVLNQLKQTEAYTELISGMPVRETSKLSDQTNSKSTGNSEESNSKNSETTDVNSNKPSDQIDEPSDIKDQESIKQSADEVVEQELSHPKNEEARNDEKTAKSVNEYDEFTEDQINPLSKDQSENASNLKVEKKQESVTEIDQQSETSEKGGSEKESNLDLKNESENRNLTEKNTENTSKSKRKDVDGELSASTVEINDDARELSSDNEELKNIQKFQKVLDDSVQDTSEQLNKLDQIMPESMFVNNAGLVLLNPFLQALFKQLELLSESGKLTDPELAACILHYAATGREGDFEFEMTFEKYLCGIPPSVPLNREISLSEEQKEEVNKVLNAVLNYWEVMKNKPIALLQNEFLMRPGKLNTEKTNHRLMIERKTFDLLLDKLPWSYSMIKFSWKKELIFVEW